MPADSQKFNQQIHGMRRRVSVLYQNAAKATDNGEVLDAAFEELQMALEELQSVEEALEEQNQHLVASRDALELDNRRYRELFEGAPLAYLVTSVEATIQQANQAAEHLLENVERFLVGRPLAIFVPEGERRVFRAELSRLRQQQGVHVFEQRLERWKGTPFDAILTVSAVFSQNGRAQSLRWHIQDITERKRAEAALLQRLSELEQRVEELMALLDADPSARSGKNLAQTDNARQRFALIADASIQLAVTLEEEIALSRVAQMMVPAFADLCMIDVIEEDGSARRITLAHGVGVGKALVAKWEQRYPVDVTVTYEAPQMLPASERDTCAAVMIAPLRARGRALGALTFICAPSSRQYSSFDLALAEELARRMSITVGNSRRYREV